MLNFPVDIIGEQIWIRLPCIFINRAFEIIQEV